MSIILLGIFMVSHIEHMSGELILAYVNIKDILAGNFEVYFF